MTTHPVTHQCSFGDSVKEVVDRVYSAIASDAITNDPEAFQDLNSHEDIVVLKNREGMFVYANERCRTFYSPEQSPLGRHGSSFFRSAELINISRRTDDLILGGSSSVAIEFTGPSFDGRTYLHRAVKRDLSPLSNPGLVILCVSRIEALLDGVDVPPQIKLGEKYNLFKALDERDREICRQVGLGVTTSKMAEQFGMTSRGVEVRKRKILKSLDLPRTIDMVKLLVRLQDNGFLDLGL